MEFWIGYLDQALIFGVYAVSLNLLVGYAGIFSVGSSAFGAFGGYTTALLLLGAGWPAIPALLAGALIGAAVAMLLAGPILRLQPEYVMLMTMALSILSISLIVALPALGSQQGLIGIPLAELFGLELLRPTDFLPWLAVALLVATAICWRIAESPVGRLLRAARDDVIAVRSLGKSPLPVQLFTFGISCGLTAFAGGMLVQYNGVASPSLFSLNQTMLVFAMVIVGGIGSIPGSIIGAILIVGVAPSLQKGLQVSPEDSALIQPIIFGALLVLIMRFRPTGILNERHRPPSPTGADQELPGSDPARAVDSGPELEPGSDASAIVNLSGLSKRFGGVQAVSDLSLSLQRGKITALVGPNGAGKSTVFNLITGQDRPDSGTVLLEGKDILGWGPDRVARAGMVRSFQDLRVFSSLTPLENVMMAGRRHAGESPALLFLRPWRSRKDERRLAARASQWLTFVGLEPGTKTATGALSFAQQKQVAFARVLATGAQVLLLDEPLSGVEGQAVEEMLSLVEKMRDLGHTICIVEHSIQAISRLADWAYFMENGTVTAEGTVADLLADPRLKEAYFGVA